MSGEGGVGAATYVRLLQLPSRELAVGLGAHDLVQYGAIGLALGEFQHHFSTRHYAKMMKEEEEVAATPLAIYPHTPLPDPEQAS